MVFPDEAGSVTQAGDMMRRELLFLLSPDYQEEKPPTGQLAALLAVAEQILVIWVYCHPGRVLPLFSYPEPLI